MARRSLILLPPSEGKAPEGSGPPWAPGTMAVEGLDARRGQVLRALGRRHEARVGPTLPAIERYTGVLYQGLEAGGDVGVGLKGEDEIAGEGRQRLKDAGVATIGPIMVGAQTWSVYFFDPHGIRLEFCYQEHDGSDVRVVERWTQTRDEALAELRSLSQDADWLDAVTRHLPASR